tara:strand:- start:530 stop:784 length:255 start_codon:yes stop_codon:yes gene_type:complete
MDLYQKVERVIQEHIDEHQSEVRKAKELMTKLDVARCNSPVEDYSYDLTATGEKFPPTTDKDWDDFWSIPDYTELPDIVKTQDC